LVVEDEPLPRQRLVRLIGAAALAGEREVREAQNGPEALRQLEAFRPHIVFLDVEMPGLSGLDVLEKRPDRDFEVVFVTAYPQYALRAFDEGACDYVLKPFRPERLYAALERASRRVDMRAELAPAPASDAGPPGLITRITVREAGSVRIIPLAEIDCFMSQDHYTLVYMRDGSEALSEMSLASLESQLDGEVFARIHRKCIVRFGAIRSVGIGTNPRVELASGLTVPLARSRRRAVLDRVRPDG
jgi:two-component system LytT family response regulator